MGGALYFGHTKFKKLSRLRINNDDYVFRSLLDFQTWQISSRSCIHENDAVIHDAENQTTTVKV